jgi:hypothetical protein
MLRVNVGLSRKLSRDYNSTGFSLNLEGELCASPDDPHTLIERIKEYYDLAEEALNQQIERYESDSAIGSRDESPATIHTPASVPPLTAPSVHTEATNPRNGNGPASPAPGNGQSATAEAATNKQVQYLLNLGKRQGFSSPQLEGRIESILGRRIGVYDLSKKEAGTVIDVLSQPAAPAANGNGNGGTRVRR